MFQNLFQNISDSKIATRKSWVVTNTSASSISSGTHILNRLSSERLKRDSTPEFNSSYHYQDEDVEFDSPSVPYDNLSNDSGYRNVSDLDTNNQLESANKQNDDNWQPGSIEMNNLSDANFEPGTSRRDTYSIASEVITKEQNVITTPRSILKSSKTVKPMRSRSSCRMVQFARLPKSNSKIKNSMSRLCSGSDFIVVDDDLNEADTPKSPKKSLQFNIEDNLDDDLAGVQPLDNSVSSLINSPILHDSSSNKSSSKRGSRGKKVLNLISSFEKRANETSKNSIKASDLLSMNGSNHKYTLSTNDSQEDIDLSQELSSNSRRINLTNILEADSFRNTSSDKGHNEILAREDNCESKDNIETSLLNNSHSENISNLNSEINSCKSPVTDTEHLVIVETENAEQIDAQCETSAIKHDVSHSVEKDCKTSTNKSLTISLNNHIDNNVQKDCSKVLDQNEVEMENCKSEAVEKSIKLKKDQLMQNNENELAIKCVDIRKDNIDVQVNNSELYEESPSMVIQSMAEIFHISDDLQTCSFGGPKANLTENSFEFIENSDQITKLSEENCVKKVDLSKNTKTNDKSDKIEEVSNKSITKHGDLNKSLVNSIEVQLEKIHEDEKNCSNSNEKQISIVDSITYTNSDKTMSNSVSDKTRSDDSNFKSNKNITNSILVNKSSIKVNANSVSKLPNIDKFTIQKNLSDSNTSLITDDASFDNNELIISSDAVSSNDQKNKTTDKNIITNNSQIKKFKLDDSKHSFKEQLNKSVNNEINAAIDYDNVKNCSSKKIVKVITESESSNTDETEDDENIILMDKNLEHTLNTSIGKPQYESTPWSLSKGSKMSPCRSTENSKKDVTEDYGDQKRNRSTSPFPDPETWSQMMKDFNESVKKVILSKNTTPNVQTTCKVLFNEMPKSNSLKIETAEQHEFLNNSDIKNSTLQSKNQTFTQHCSIKTQYLVNDSTVYDKVKRSPRACNKSLPKNDTKKLSNKKTAKKIQLSLPKTEDVSKSKSINDVISPNKINSVNNKITFKTNKQLRSMKSSTEFKADDNRFKREKKVTLKISEPETSEYEHNSSPSLQPTRRNLRKRLSVNEPMKSTRQHTGRRNKTLVKSSTDSESEVDSSKLINMTRTSKRSKQTNQNQSSHASPIKSKKNNSIFKINTTTRSTRSSVLMSDKIHKSPNIKSNKTKKTNTTKKTKTNLNSQSKILQSSKSVKSNTTSNSSGFETVSESEEESVQKSQSADDLQKKNSVKTKKKDVIIESTSLPEIRNLRRKITETSNNASPKLVTRSRKRAADTSTICQSNSKGQKRDKSSKIASSTASRTSNSPLKESLSDKKRTRNASKTTVVQMSNNSFPEIAVLGKTDKPKSNENTRAKKRRHNSEDTSIIDSAPLSVRQTRTAIAKMKENQIKKPSTSKSKIKNSETEKPKNAIKVKFK